MASLYLVLQSVSSIRKEPTTTHNEEIHKYVLVLELDKSDRDGDDDENKTKHENKQTWLYKFYISC